MSTSRTKNFERTRIAALLLTLLLCLPVLGQTVSAASPQLTDDQAQALIHVSQSGLQLTPEQSQILMQYLLQKNQFSSAPAGPGSPQPQAAQTHPAQVMSNQPAMGASATAITAQATATMPAVQGAAPGSEKKPGVVRIGIALPKVQIGQGVQGPSAGEALRAELIQYLTGPSLEVIPIAALLPQQVEAEAAAKQCDYLVYNNLSQKKSGGGLGFFKGASSLASMIPMAGAAGSAAGAMATATAIEAVQTAVLTSEITAKSQVLLEYHVSVMGSATPVLSNSLTGKATTDGEDIISPLVEQEATAIFDQLTRKK